MNIPKNIISLVSNSKPAKTNPTNGFSCTYNDFTNFVYSEKTNTYIASGKTKKGNKLAKVVKFAASKGFALAKRVVPGIVMMTTALTVGPMIRSCTQAGQQQAAMPSATMMYEAGQQHIRDSLRIAELEKQLAADTIKTIKKFDSAHLAKVAKHIK